MKTFTFFLSFILILSISTQVLAQSACNEKFQTGTCVCELADGSGTVDLTPLQTSTATQPYFYYCLPSLGLFQLWNFRLVATTNDSLYFFSFCNPIVESILTDCSGVASSCEYTSQDNASVSINLGQPETTRFEMRTSPNFPTPQLALVVDSDEINERRRTVTFLVCSLLIHPEVLFTADGDSGTTDPDGSEVYVSQTLFI